VESALLAPEFEQGFFHFDDVKFGGNRFEHGEPPKFDPSRFVIRISFYENKSSHPRQGREPA
jgi:hypothetical protein